LYARHWLWDYTADRSVDRVFHPKPSEANDDVVAQYRVLLLERITELRREDERGIALARTELGKDIAELEKELAVLDARERELEARFVECERFAEETAELEREVAMLRRSVEMAVAQALKQKEEELIKEKERLSKKQAELWAMVEQRPDVSSAVQVEFL
jgi:hypothetical protein